MFKVDFVPCFGFLWVYFLGSISWVVKPSNKKLDPKGGIFCTGLKSANSHLHPPAALELMIEKNKNTIHFARQKFAVSLSLSLSLSRGQKKRAFSHPHQHPL